MSRIDRRRRGVGSAGCAGYGEGRTDRSQVRSGYAARRSGAADRRRLWRLGPRHARARFRLFGPARRRDIDGGGRFPPHGGDADGRSRSTQLSALCQGRSRRRRSGDGNTAGHARHVTRCGTRPSGERRGVSVAAVGAESRLASRRARDRGRRRRVDYGSAWLRADANRLYSGQRGACRGQRWRAGTNAARAGGGDVSVMASEWRAHRVQHLWPGIPNRHLRLAHGSGARLWRAAQHHEPHASVHPRREVDCLFAEQ